MNPLIRPAMSQRSRSKAVLRSLVTYSALFLAGLLTIPVCVCSCLIECVRSGADRILRMLDS